MSSIDVLEELFGNLPRQIVFSSRPEAIPGDLRVPWRICTLCLILDKFRSGKARLEQLHIIWWAVRTKNNRDLFLRWFSDEKRPDEAIVRFDPSLSATVDLALGQQLVERSSSGAIGLTTSGKELARAIWQVDQVLPAEKEFLNKIPNKLTQRVMKEVPEWT